jgi:hypothetical protein
MKRFIRKLRKSHSVHNDTRDAREKPGTSNGVANLTPSRTFDPTRSYRLGDDCRSHSFMDATSSSTGQDRLVDPELDRTMMQTITDVKYVKRRPKFTAVVDANFQRQCLEAHNLVRQKYGSPSLIWSQELADLAKAWATKLADRGRILYPELPGIGENIHLVKDEAGDHLTTGSELVALWASEADNFDFANPRWNTKCQNFTQMVWRSSIEMGVARCWNTSKNYLAIVTFYRPAGNLNTPGEFAANLPSKGAVPEDARSATQLGSLIHSMNRSPLSDGGFRTRYSSSHPRY